MTRRRLAAIVAASVAFVVLLAGGLVFVFRAGKQAGETTSAAPASTAPAVPRSSCGLVGTMGPVGDVRASWENVAGWWLPYSVSDGPFHRDPVGAWSCFAHTQTGAVLAGFVIAMRADGVAEDWKSVVRTQTVPGAGQTAKLAAPVSQTSGVTTARGFSIVGYTDNRATISYYLHQNTFEGSCTVNVDWYAGDWRVELADDGGTSSGCTQGVPASFTPWGPPA